MHNGLGCVFHRAAVVGPGCKIYQNVTLGGNSKVQDGEIVNRGAPVLEKDVTVFAGACVLGPVTIHEGAVIGANAVVTKDVPAYYVAKGNPAAFFPLASGNVSKDNL